MVNYARVQHHIDRGLGKAAQKLGQPYTAYRVSPTSSGDFPDAWQVLKLRVPILWRRITDTKLYSSLRASGTMYADMVFNAEPYELGDVFVCSDPDYVPGRSYGAGATVTRGSNEMNALALAWHLPVRKPVGAWLNRLARIYRPASAPTIMQDGTLYWKETLDNDVPLVLVNGEFIWGLNGQTASLVPVGLGATERPSRGTQFPPPIPGMVSTSRWYVYVPPLQGYTPVEGDAIVLDTDARYQVLSPYAQQSGFVGSQLAVERTTSQVA